MAQSLGLLILLLLPAPVAAEERWLPLLVDGERLAGPGVWLRGSDRWYPVVLLGRRLRHPVGVNRVAGVLVVDGREHPAEVLLADGVAFASEALLQRVFPDLLLDPGEETVRLWTSAALRAQAAASEGSLALLRSAAQVRDGRLVVTAEVANRGTAPASGTAVVTLLEPDGRTYASFHQPLGVVEPGERRSAEMVLWLAPLRLVGSDRVELHPRVGTEAPRTLRWTVALAAAR